jgi:hypothetical protein
VVKDVHEHQYKRVRSDELVEDNTILAKCGQIQGSPQELLAWDVPRFERYDIQYDQILGFFPGGKGIRLVDSNVQRPMSKKLTAAGDYKLGLLVLGCRVLHFIHDPTNRPFVVVVGSQRNGIWCALVVDFETDKPNLEVIEQSYSKFGTHADIPQKNFDRISKFLTDDVAIVVEVQHQNQNKVGLVLGPVLNIRIVNKLTPAILPIHTRQYVISVSFSSAIKASFSLLEAYPDSSWDARGNNTMNLFLNDSSTSATLCFEHKQHQKRFAVTLGFCNETIWSDVHFLDIKYGESAKDVCNSYHDIQKRGALKGRSESSTASASTSLRPPGFPQPMEWVWKASIHPHPLGKSRNQYKSEIEVFGRWWGPDLQTSL